MNQPFTPILLADCNRQSSRKRARRGASEGEKGRITIHRSPPATPRAARRWLGSAAVAAVCFALMRAGLPPAQAAAAGNWYERGKLGLFDHYCFGGSAYAETIYPNGALPVDLNQCANAFNAQQLADDASAFGVDYVILTAMHANLNLLYPSAKMDHWRPGHSANRDVIQACIDALKPKGIKLALYIHATDGTDFTPADQLATGWNNATNHYAVWNAFINDIFAELGNRYGTNLDGYWLDMVFSSEFQTRIDKTRLKATMLLGNADRILIGNGARADGSDGPEYSSLEYYPPDSDTVGVASQIATIASAGNWWATLPAGRNGAKYTPEQLFRSTVIQASASARGGIAWDAGSYCGGGWEDGVKAMFLGLAAYLQGVSESIRGTYPSTSYILAPGTHLSGLSKGIAATKSADDKYEYIHVLNPPTGSALKLPRPSDGKRFGSAIRLNNGHPLTLLQDNAGVTLTLPGSETWSPVDTVLKLTASDSGLKEINDTDPGITYTGAWGHSTARGAGDYFDDVHYTTANGDSFQYSFTGAGVAVIMPTSPDYGSMVFSLDGALAATNTAYSVSYQPQQTLFIATNLAYGAHRLKGVKTGGVWFQVDAIQYWGASRAVLVEPPAVSGGQLRAGYSGTPKGGYRVDRSTALAGPWELGWTNLVAGSDGTFELADSVVSSLSACFYRVSP